MSVCLSAGKQNSQLTTDSDPHTKPMAMIMAMEERASQGVRTLTMLRQNHVEFDKATLQEAEPFIPGHFDNI